LEPRLSGELPRTDAGCLGTHTVQCLFQAVTQLVLGETEIAELVRVRTDNFRAQP
jgi:hypothetical protein